MFLETLTLRTHLETRLGGGQLSHYGIRKDLSLCVSMSEITAYAVGFSFAYAVGFSFLFS